MAIQIDTNWYNDFKAVMSGFQEKGNILVTTSYLGTFLIAFIGSRYDFLITFSGTGTPPPSLAADFPNINITTLVSAAISSVEMV
jgi:hypothetical protein